MATKVYVQYLSWATSDDSLRTAFSEFGQVLDAYIVKDPNTGRSKGSGFVKFSSKDEATEAVGGMDGQVLDGRVLKVSIVEDDVLNQNM